MVLPCTSHSDAARLYPFQPTTLNRPARLLSLDGGGVRGIITSKIMQHIEERTHQPLCKKFDLISTVSTGTIEGLALTTPACPSSNEPKFSAEDLVNLYRTRAKDIFPQPSMWTKPWKWFRETTYAEYDPTSLVNVVKEYCGESLLKDALTEVLVLSQEITESNPWYFQRSIARMDPHYATLKKVDVIRCATAAPTYFPPMPMTFGENAYAFIDAGVAANTPSVTGYIESKHLFNTPDDRCLVVSIGTGICKEKIPYTGTTNWGLAKWAPKMIDLMMQSSSELAHKQMCSIFPDISHGKNYFRFQPEISPELNILDNSTPAVLDALIECAHELIENETDQFNQLFEKLDDN